MIETKAGSFTPEARLLIDGELADAESGQQFDNINPATEEVLGQVADAGHGDMDRAIAAARRAFDETDWSANHALRKRCGYKASGIGRQNGIDGFETYLETKLVGIAG